MDKTITIILEGTPVPKGRPRFGNGRAYTPKRTKDYENALKALIKEQKIEGPIEVLLNAVFPRPQRLMPKKYPDGLILHTKRPDLDNIIKAVLDALNKTLQDDAQVCTIHAYKYYAERNQNARTEVTIRTAK
jgi:Holliday junction resolvase RusA-like endonuclease